MRVCRLCRSLAFGRPPGLIVIASAAAVSLLSIPAFAGGPIPTGWSLAATVDGGASSLGSSIATTDKVAVVGAPFATLASGGTPAGAVFVYSGGGGGWAAQQLAAPAPIDGGNFGTSVAAAGNLVAVGAAGTPPAAYAFAADGGAYQSLRTWADPANDTNQSFGGSVAVLEGEAGTSYVAVSAPPGPSNPSGTVYVSHQVDGGVWSDPPTAISDPSAQSFGIAVAFAGNGELLVGDPGTDSGRVLVYSALADGGWASAGTLTFSLDGGSVEQFGNAIAAWKNLVVVTAPGTSNDAGTYNGAAFLFASDDAGAWAQETVLTGTAAESFGNFSAAVNGGLIAIGSAINTASSGAGQVDVWAESGGTWTRVPSTALVGDSYYGQAVGLVGSTLFVGDTNGAVSVSGVSSSLLIYTPLYDDAGASADASGGASDASPSLDGAAPDLDGSGPLPSPDAASTEDGGDSGAGGTGTSASNSGGCGCATAGRAAGDGALAIAAECALAFLVWTRRRGARLRSREPRG